MTPVEVADNVRELCFLPQTSEFSDQKILDATNMAMRMALTPSLLRANGEYLTEIIDVLPDQTTGDVRIPRQAVASTSRVLTWVYSDGTESTPLQFCSIADQPSASFGNYAIGSPTQFVLTPDGIRVLGGVPSGVYMRVKFSRRPGKLILPAQVPSTGPVGLKISTAGPAYTFLGVYGALSGLPVLENGAVITVEISSGISPFRVKVFDAVITGAAGSWAITLPTGSTYTPQIGDLITTPDTAWNPQFPEEWHDLLCYYGAARMAGLRKDRTRKEELLGDAQSILHELINEVTPRAKLAPKVLNAMRGHVRRPWRWG